MNITKSEYGFTQNNTPIYLYHMENTSGASVTVTDYGCRLIGIEVPNRQSNLTNICLGLRDIEQYLEDDISLGAVVGRYANRIAKGNFTLNDKSYELAVNNGPNHLHGGPTGFGQRVFDAAAADDKITFSRTSPDGEEGYPGNLTVSVTYGWSEDNELSILYEASSDQDTIFNITSHGYFNLNGGGDKSVLEHELRIDADFMTEIDDTQIPTGALIPVEHTPFDFREFKTIGQDIHANDAQLGISGTYDHNLVLNGTGLREAAVLQSKASGIRMTCFTDQPGIQLYVPGNADINDSAFGSVCLETQHYPDSIHHPEFPSVILRTGEIFKSKTIYHFSVM